MPKETYIYNEDWWYDAFARTANASERRGHKKGDKRMHLIIAYDIADPKRLKKISDCCENYGVRVQYSIFECRLEADRFDKMWNELDSMINQKEDKLVAYPLHGSNARNIRTAGTMTCQETVVAYIF